MNRYELYIPLDRPTRNSITGRYLKGHIPYNKGRRWDEWMSKKKQEKSRKNLEKGRGWYKGQIIPPSIKRMKKVIAIVDHKIMAFESIHSAAEKTGLSFKDISRCCNINHNRSVKFRTVNSIRFFFESDYEIWGKV